MNLQIAGFLDNSTKNGLGIRSVVFVSGCNHDCRGCHNKELQDFMYGKSMSVADVYNCIIKNYPLIDGVTFSGGEPFESTDALYQLALLLKKDNINIWVYSGYSFEFLIGDPNRKKLLELCDILVDGKFVETLKDSSLKFKGSSNQRIIDIQKSISENKIFLNE